MAFAAAVGCSDASGPARPAGSLDAGFGAEVLTAADVPPSGRLARRAPQCAATPPGSSPVDYGRRELAAALAQAGVTSTVLVTTVDDAATAAALAAASITVSPASGAFAMFDDVSGARRVAGRDAVGAMYGAFELAESVRRDAALAPLAAPVVRTPATEVRAANLFLSLPAPGERGWWFLDEGFWCEYLDLLARSRFETLDLHGMYDLDNTLFPNALLYFATSASHPTIGVAPPDRARNLAMLQRVVAMAAARGIRVQLMTYRSDTSPTADAPLALDDAALRVYTREATADLARNVPGLARFGFRVGESGHDTPWYIDTMVQGLRDAGSSIGVYTRTWGATIDGIRSLAQNVGSGLMIEAKYNGEQLGAPYVITGGTMAAIWANYSYEDYLQDPSPYRFVFQVRSGGTHRIFRHASFERARRTALSLGLGGSRGFTMEGAHAYSPQFDFHHRDAVDRFAPWTFRRDELQYLLYGRLAYDPTTPETPFREALADRVGTTGLWDAVQAASDIVPWMLQGRACGPDHRQAAPELEWGGRVDWWAAQDDVINDDDRCGYHGPFDNFALASPYDTAQDLVAGRGTSRLSSLELARIVLDRADRARVALQVPVVGGDAEARDVVRECAALADLGTYYAHKLRAATALAVYRSSGRRDYLDAARAESALSSDAWATLVVDTAYIAPFREPLRMCEFPEYCDDPHRYHFIHDFHWSVEAVHIPQDAVGIDAVEAAVAAMHPAPHDDLPDARAWLDGRRGDGPGLQALTVDPATATGPWTVTADFANLVPAGAAVRVWWKPFSGYAQWRSVDATGAGTRFRAAVPGQGGGAMFAVEVAGPRGVGWRYPDVTRETPYRVRMP